MKKRTKILIVILIIILFILPLFSPLLAHGYNTCITGIMESRVKKQLKKLDIEICDSAEYHGKLSGNGNGTSYSCVFLIKGDPEKIMESLNTAELDYYFDYVKESKNGIFDIELLEHRHVEFDDKAFIENPSEYFALCFYDSPKLDWFQSSDICSH